MQAGTGYAVAREVMFDPYIGLIPCGGFPLGEVLVIDLNTQTQKWRKPHGQFPGWLKGVFNAGLPQLGGPLLTSSGVFFLGSALKAPCEPTMWILEKSCGSTPCLRRVRRLL